MESGKRVLRAFARASCCASLLLASIVTRADDLADAQQAADHAEAKAQEAELHGPQAISACDRAIEFANTAIDAAAKVRKAADRTSTGGKAQIEAADAAEEKAQAAGKCDNYFTRPVTDRLEVFPFLGFAVDTFSADVGKYLYLNPEDSGDARTRETFGLWFQYPLWGPDQDKRHLGLYLYGQTLHGVRSTEIDCSANSALFENPKCKDAHNTPPANTTALYILRNASSLEGTIGMRFEFLELQKGNGRGNAALYVSRQIGFVSVSNSDGDVADINHFGLGARIREGKYRNSYIEVGRGTNDLFKTGSGDRTKVNARIVVRFDGGAGFFSKRGLFFAHLVADVDGHDGPDAVQTYIGVAFCPWGDGKCGAQ